MSNEGSQEKMSQDEYKIDIAKVFDCSSTGNIMTNLFNIDIQKDDHDEDDNEDDDEENQGFFKKTHDKLIDNNKKEKEEEKKLSMINKKRERNNEGKKGLKTVNKKQICQFYINGACNKGDKCLYSHNTEQIHKKEICKFFLSNNCSKGNKCLYSHNLKECPCKFFHARGFCENLDQCRFSHQRLNENEIFNFIKENEHFLFEVREKYGTTNMEDFFNYYLKQKNALPKNVMIPDCIKNDMKTTNQIIPNMNIKKNPMNFQPTNMPNFPLVPFDMMQFNQMMMMQMNNASNAMAKKPNNINTPIKLNTNTIDQSPPTLRIKEEEKTPSPSSITQTSPIINPFQNPKEYDKDTIKDFLSFMTGSNKSSK